MKMPQVKIEYLAGQDGVASFKTLCCGASGVVYVAQGEKETHYDVQSAEKIADSSTEEITPYNNETGSFNVVGNVVDIFDDEMVVVESLGFTFWVEPELGAGLAKGNTVRLRVKNLTFYI